MKKIGLFLMVMVISCFISASAFAAAVDKQHFDESISSLQASLASVKGDTTQIVSILGHVFEGTVPSGGTLTSLCNQNGWNLIVLMGHNNISNPDRVKAGASFTYPKTTSEFRAALRKGKPLYTAWLKTKKTTFKVNRIQTDTVDINKLNVKVAHISEELKVKNMKIDQLQIRQAEITEKLRIKEAEIENLRVQNATIDQLRIRLAEIEKLRIQDLAVKNALIEKLRIAQLQIGQKDQQIAQLRAEPYRKYTGQSAELQKSDFQQSRPYNMRAMRLIQTGDICDEEAFYGDVGQAVLAQTGGRPADAIEMHDREAKKSPRYKGKRVHVNKNGQSIPYVRLDGTCVRVYSDSELTAANINSLLLPGETTSFTNFSDIGKKNPGAHLTQAVILIQKY